MEGLIEFTLSGNPSVIRRIKLRADQIESIREIADCKDVVTVTMKTNSEYDVLSTYEEATKKWQAAS